MKGAVVGMVRVLGAIAVDDAPVRSARVRRLLAVLALEPGRVVAVDRLVAHVWPDDPPEHGEAALHSLVARARRVLGDGVLRTEPPGYVLDLPTDALDATAVVALRDRARAGAGAADLLDEALALWRGPAFAEFADEEPFRPVAARLGELRADLEDARARADLDLGRPADAVARLEELVAAAPFRERRRELLVEALHRAGRAGDALAAVAAHRRLLADELGLDPGPEMRRLEALVLAGSPPAAPEVLAANVTSAAPEAARASFAAPPGPALRGRDTALAGIAAAIGDGPVTLVGPGGVGKTTLARHVAAAVGASFADGVVVAELATVATGAEVAPAVVAAVGAPGASGTDPRDRVPAVLRGRRLLLVLDNAEHVVDAVAALVTGLAAACPTVAVLATSREPLGVTGERVRPVPPLAEDAAVALFAERAAAADPAFALSDANREAVTEICRRLDRLPLALELAAARMRVLSPAELAADLPLHRRFLRSPHRGADLRHRTLHAVVDWSYRLLDPREQTVLARLGVFAGSFTLAAARAVADDPDLDGVLADLVDKSLVTASVDHARHGPSRYALLETVRAYARERLEEAGETAALHRRHAEEARGFLRRTGRLAGPDADRRLAAVLAEWDELRAAVAWASAHDPALAADLVAALVDVGEVRMTPELFAWAEALLAGGGDLGAARAAVHAVAAEGARFAGDLDRAERHVAEGRRALADGDDGAAAVLAFLHSEVAGFAGRSAESASAAADAERLAAAAGDHRVWALACCCRVLAVAYDGDRDEALAGADALDAAVRDGGDPLMRPWSVYTRGEVRVEHDPAAALDLVVDAARRARAVGEQYVLGVALVTVTSLHARQGDVPAAARAAAESLEHWRGTGNRTHQWVGLRAVVELLVQAGRDEVAAELLGGLVARRSGGPLFGADAARLAVLRDALAARLGADALARAEHRGAARDDDGLVDLAREALRDS
ncbi:BTAD domain-containing putative transcriptional regulator [Actinomycetospora lutea]|uniref:BTAD domain-containing putative transcriptional regulator n=1 Tax=Actinomycetospora lutea TaxID=663604 RepID=UPI00236679C5|nr:BTAD domain-containing putative transcriptional regulator [Actinomycetospora lutea]MDD7940709.1 BTAD domain-containing putative transcriptional regulator [Actinomycetospora lutea]